MVPVPETTGIVIILPGVVTNFPCSGSNWRIVALHVAIKMTIIRGNLHQMLETLGGPELEIPSMMSIGHMDSGCPIRSPLKGIRATYIKKTHPE